MAPRDVGDDVQMFHLVVNKCPVVEITEGPVTSEIPDDNDNEVCGGATTEFDGCRVS